MSLVEKSCPTCVHEDVAMTRLACADCGIGPGGERTAWVPRPEKPGSGRKDDAGKDPWGLLPFDAVRAIVKVLAFGAVKYSARNWERGMDWHRPFDACLRHLTAWWGGEKADPETGYSHLWHAGCCVLFLIAYEIRGVGKDDRPQKFD